MPLVFVHGVNVRRDQKYERETRQRNENFARILFPLLGRELQPDSILNPFWGDLATGVGTPYIPAPPQWMLAKLTRRLVAANGSLLHLARQRPMHEVFEVMVATSMENVTTDREAEEVSRLGLLLLRFGRKFEGTKQREWLEGVNSEEEFVSKLEQEIDKEQKLDGNCKPSKYFHSSVSWIKQRYSLRQQQTRTLLLKGREGVLGKVDKIRKRTRKHAKILATVTRTAATNVAATTFTQPLRKLFHERMYFFIGDAFLYFGQRGTASAPGPIVQRLSQAMAEARSRTTSADPEVVVIAHSMGGNIVCDYVSQFDTESSIDLLITVGSQFSLFADLSMFPGLGIDKPFRKPACVKRWINVYDDNDFFAFAAQPLFDGIEDLHYASGRLGMTTHADCFKFISLYEHIAQAVLSTDCAY